ncbi:MAG: hypothetical protein FGM29_02535 [Actinobacteria bacterium]|nr:hypothetical protein [Actinomycetota bacterium]
MSDDGIRGLWTDLVRAAKDLAWASVEVRQRDLVRVLQARGCDARTRFRVIGGILQDHLLDVDHARQLLGRATFLNNIDLPSAIEAAAGLNEDDRVALAADFLCLPLPTSHYVVWLAIERASMPRVVMPIGTGSVTLYDSRLIAEVLGAEPDARRKDLPAELLSAGSYAGMFPADQFTLLARVDLGVRHGSFVDRDARLRLLTLLAPSSRFYPADWSVLPGSVVFRDDIEASYSVFEDVAQTNSSHRLDGVADGWLTQGASALEPHLAAQGSEQLTRLLKLVEWDAAHRSGDAITRVLLSVRTIETIAASHVGDMTWQELLMSYRSVFTWSQLKSELSSTAWHALVAYDRHPDERCRTRLREIHLEVVNYRRSEIVTRLDVLVDRLPEICELWDTDEEWSSGVLVERAVRHEQLVTLQHLWTDAASFQARMDEIEGDLALRERRLVRVRNAAQHGGPILDESVRSIVDLADRARQQIIADMVDGLVKGRACSSTLDGVRRLSDRRRRILSTTKSPVSALSVPVEFT